MPCQRAATGGRGGDGNACKAVVMMIGFYLRYSKITVLLLKNLDLGRVERVESRVKQNAHMAGQTPILFI